MMYPTLLPKNTPVNSSVLTQLLEIEQICFQKDAWSKNMLLSSMQQDFVYTWIIKDMQASKVVAYAVLYLAGDEGDIANIAVLPSYRNIGLGGALLDAMLSYANIKQAKTVYLEVRQSNAAAIRLYLSRGFKETGKRKNYYKNPREDALLMAKAVFHS